MASPIELRQMSEILRKHAREARADANLAGRLRSGQRRPSLPVNLKSLAKIAAITYSTDLQEPSERDG